MRKLGVLMVVSALAVAMLPAGAAVAQEPIRGETDHVLDLTNTVEDGYLLAWVGTIEGDIDGCIEWWIELATWTNVTRPDHPGQASHYTMKTRVYSGESCGTLVLETIERGTTTMANTSWRANGRVTYANPDHYPGWQGRSVHEQGRFSVEMYPFEGTSTLRIN